MIFSAFLLCLDGDFGICIDYCVFFAAWLVWIRIWIWIWISSLGSIGIGILFIIYDTLRLYGAN